MITGGSSDLTNLMVSARRDRSLSAIRPWSSGAIDLVFSKPNVRLTDDDGPGLTLTPPMIRSSRMQIEPSCLPRGGQVVSEKIGNEFEKI